jgi:DNA replication protein DnaC
VVSRRYDKGSMVLTSNRGFGDWGLVFADQVVASAFVDRLLHNASVLNIRGTATACVLTRTPRTPKEVLV